MGLGTYAKFVLKGTSSDLEKIYEYTHDADDGEFYERVFKVDSSKMSDEELEDFLYDVGVSSLTQASCSSKWYDDKHTQLDIETYSVYDIPLGAFEKIAEEFPKVCGYGDVIREEDEDLQGSIGFYKGTVKYDEPDYIDEDDEDEDEEE